MKRVVGFPGETIEIRGGDVYVNGEMARKSLAKQREMAVLVHDTAWPYSKHDVHSCWLTKDRWMFTSDSWRSDAIASRLQWLNYLHLRRSPSLPPAVEESPVLDEDGYNQAASRQLNQATDLMLVCNLSAIGQGQLAFKANDGRETFQVSIVPVTGAITLEETVMSCKRFKRRLASSLATELVLSLIDRQVILAIEGRELLNYPFDPVAETAAGTSTPFAIGSSGLDVQVTRIQIYRDIYYTPATRASDSKSRQLGPDEYFVLGDNSPISRDSRSWMGGELVRGSSLVGRLLAVFRRRATAN